MPKATSSHPTGQRDRSRLLGLERRQFSVLFDLLDADNDKNLNASEMRNLFSLLFGDPVSTEHLLHFENRYLLQYGKNGCLSKAKFFEILEDYEDAYGYDVGDDIKEFFYHFIPEDSTRTSPIALCQAISETLPQEDHNDLNNLLSRLIGASKTGADINCEVFRIVIGEMFKISNHQLAKSSAGIVVEEGSSIKHPFYRNLMMQRVANFLGDKRDAVTWREMLNRVADEMVPRSKTGITKRSMP